MLVCTPGTTLFVLCVYVCVVLCIESASTLVTGKTCERIALCGPSGKVLVATRARAQLWNAC